MSVLSENPVLAFHVVIITSVRICTCINFPICIIAGWSVVWIVAFPGHTHVLFLCHASCVCAE